MRQGGKSPLGIMIVVIIILAAALGGLILYSALDDRNESAYAGVLGISEDTGKTVVYNNGEITDIPDNAVIVGGLTGTWGMLSDSLKKTGSDASDPEDGKTIIVADNDGNAQKTGDGNNEGSSSVPGQQTETGTEEGSTVDQEPPVETDPEKSSMQAVMSSAIENANLVLAYYENQQK